MPISDVTLFPSGAKDVCHKPSSSRIRRGTGSTSSRKAKSSLDDNTHTRTKRGETYGPLIPRIEGLMCPGDIDLDGIPPCLYCEDDDNSLSKRDGDSCWLDPYRSKESRCELGSDSRRRSISERNLDKRANKPPVKWPHGGETYELGFPSYDSCGTAISDSKVQRWYGYPKTQPNGCVAQIAKLTARDINEDEFVTEHVYETQILSRFMRWLVTGTLPVGYTNPSYDWVSEVLLGCSAIGGRQDRVFKGRDFSYDNVWGEMASGLGGTQYSHLLVLADEGMNGRKGHMFSDDNISASNENNNKNTRIAHRNYAGVFYYMRIDTVWSKFVEVSKHMEDVLSDFDEEYDWGGTNTAGEPGLPNRIGRQPRAGLRDLYCYFIDFVLNRIETQAGIWLTTATSNYRNEYSGEPQGQAWLNTVLKPNGYISANNLRFRHATTQHAAPDPTDPDIWLASNYEGLWAHGAAGPF